MLLGVVVAEGVEHQRAVGFDLAAGCFGEVALDGIPEIFRGVVLQV
jgi:hypothetical protein